MTPDFPTARRITLPERTPSFGLREPASRSRRTRLGVTRLVVLCHGFPELAYSWRQQIPALADVRVIAPGRRGYGGSVRSGAGRRSISA